MLLRRMLLWAAPMVMAAAATGCTATYRYTQTASAAAPPRAAGCDFTLIEVLPDPTRYEQLGVLEDPRVVWPSTVDDFKKMARAHVCQAGADVVIPQINGLGIYVRAILYRERAAPQRAAAQ